jgi:hypothetical protein
VRKSHCSRLAPISAGEIVEVRAVQLGLEAGSLDGRSGAVLRGPASIGCCPGAKPLELLGQRRIRGGECLVYRLGTGIPAPGYLVASGCDPVALF